MIKEDEDIQSIIATKLEVLIEYQKRDTLLNLIRTGHCQRKRCERTCPVYTECNEIVPLIDATKRREIRFLKAKERAIETYLLRYGEEELFEALL